jgi:hypothetical protein
MPVLPKKFPSKALDTVTCDRFSDFSRNRHPKATMLKIVLLDINDKIPVLDPFPFFGKPQEIGSMQQSVVLGERFSS